MYNKSLCDPLFFTLFVNQKTPQKETNGDDYDDDNR